MTEKMNGKGDITTASTLQDGKPVEKWTELEIKKESRRIWKNIFLISIGFLMVFNAFQGLARLQSSLHRVEGMGVITQSVLYATLVISCLFFPKILISLIGHKWTIPLSFMGYILWMAANGYAVWGTMITASIIVGLAAAPLWTAQCSYFTKIAVRYAQLKGEKEQDVITKFFGIFFMFFQMSTIIGSIISFTVLRPVEKNGTSSPEFTIDEVHLYCGVNDCPNNNITNPNLEKPDDTTVWTMVGIYMAIAIAAVIMICIFVDQLPRDLRDPRVSGKELAQLAVATVKQLRHKEQLLLIVLTMYSGFEQAFFNAEFSASFVSCSLGIYKVGLVSLSFGVVNTITSFSTGQLVKYTGRIPIFITGLCVDLCTQFTLMFWLPDPNQEYVLFILSGMWGLTDGIWQTQINALYGSIFSKESEAAFSNYRLWESLGFVVAFAYSSFLCTSIKLYILTCILGAGMIGYFLTEWVVHRRKTNSLDNNFTLKGGPESSDSDQQASPARFSYTGDTAGGYDNPALTAI